MAEADLSKIVSIIMENPKLVEEIREMVSKSETDNDNQESIQSTAKDESCDVSVPVSSPEESTYTESRASKRNQLLRAMRPYLSEERGKAIESMITIADILFAIREK